MPTYTKVSIILKDDDNHADYNKRIIEYLNDRHMAINDNMFTIAIDLVDDSNMNNYVLEGLESVPAIKITESEPFIYGVNSILATLAKLEIVDNSDNVDPAMNHSITTANQKVSKTTDSLNAFYEMSLQEMKSDDQENPDVPSTLRAYNQDFTETSLTEKEIEEKSQAYNQIYEERKRRNKSGPGPGNKGSPIPIKKPTKPGKGMDVDKFIKAGGFDKGEEMLMRRIAQNLED